MNADSDSDGFQDVAEDLAADAAQDLDDDLDDFAEARSAASVVEDAGQQRQKEAGRQKQMQFQTSTSTRDSWRTADDGESGDEEAQENYNAGVEQKSSDEVEVLVVDRVAVKGGGGKGKRARESPPLDLSSEDADDAEAQGEANSEEGHEDHRILRSISYNSNSLAHESRIRFTKRVLVKKDSSFLFGLGGTIAAVCLMGLGTAWVPHKHHYILSLVLGLGLSGGINAAMVASHFQLLQLEMARPFSTRSLGWIPPIEASMLALVSLTICVKWSVLLGLVPLVIGMHDSLTIAGSQEDMQFAAVVLEMASEILLLDRKFYARTWGIFALQNLWLTLWTCVFVDFANWSTNHVSLVVVGFLFFALFWSTQTLRSLLSFFVTGSVVFRLVLDSAANQGDSDDDGEEAKSPRVLRPQEVFQSASFVQNVLLRRGVTTCVGSICAGGLMLSPSSALWGTSELWRRLRGKPSALGNMSPAAASDRDVATRVLFNWNRYAWARVALRGSQFNSASRDAWIKITGAGVHGVLKHDCAETILRCWSWIFGALTALCSLLFLPASTHEQSEILLLFFISSFCLGAANAALLLEPLRATVAAIFVSFAEDPTSIERSYPIVHHRFKRLAELTLVLSESSDATSP